MNNNTIEQQLKKYEKQDDTNWQKLVYTLRRHLDNWGHTAIKSPWGQMKLSYYPVIFNISVDGTTAVDITRRSMVTKQSLSRTVKELEEKGIITTKTDPKDKRSERLCLTQAGKEWVLEAYMQLEKLTNIYIDLIGEKDLLIAATVLGKIIAYHEQTDTSSAEEV